MTGAPIPLEVLAAQLDEADRRIAAGETARHEPKRDDDYEAFLAGKRVVVAPAGFEPDCLPPSLFPHQADIATWAVRRGRAAVFADTGLGKSRISVAWAHQVVRRTGGSVIILTPLAVAAQMSREGTALGIPVTICRDGADVRPGINVTNYERLHRFDPSSFAGVVLDESSCIKHADAKTFAILTEAFSATPYKLCATATPAPNDWTELGTHAEFLGVRTRAEMLAEYFVHDSAESAAGGWRLKGHARAVFWRWVAEWGALVRKPSDLGHDDGGYNLPPLNITTHVLPVDQAETHARGLLFAAPALSLTDQRAAKRASVGGRVAKVAELANADDEQWILWCELNAEADAVTKAVRGAVQIAGADSIDLKESRLLDFIEGRTRVLVTKPSIACFGVNAQNAHKMAFVGVTHSYEQRYQAIRRCYRFGQKHPVEVHVVCSEAELPIIESLSRKEKDAAEMGDELSLAVRAEMLANVRGVTRQTNPYNGRPGTLPAWIQSEVA